MKRSLLGGFVLGSGLSASGFGQSGPFQEQPLALTNDWQAVRSQFPLDVKRTFLNTASLGPSPKRVIDTVYAHMMDLAERAYTGRKECYQTHEKLGAMLNTAPENLAITRNTTEGANIAARSLRLKAGDEVLLTNHEHVGGAAPWLALQEQNGVKVKLVRLDLSGRDNLNRLESAITPRTRVVAWSHVTCPTGMVLPIKEIVALCRPKGIYTCFDAAQSVGMLDIDLADIQPDFLYSSGHKWLFGPKGTGILYINPALMPELNPVFVGAYTDKAFDLESLQQEYLMIAQREEYGTRNAPIVMGLGEAVRMLQEIGMPEVEARGKSLVSYFRKGLKDALPQVELLTPEDPNLSGAMVTFRLPGYDYAAVKHHLFAEHKMVTRGIYEADLDALRVSCAIFNQEAELDQLVGLLQEVHQKGIGKKG